MRQKDKTRLFKALLISLIFHIFLFLGMNFIEWFPETDSENKYLPLSVKIQSYPVEVIKREVERNEDLPVSSGNKIPEVYNKPLEKSVTKPEISSVSSSSETVFDPYADLGMNNNYSTSPSAPVLPDEGVRKTEYIPKGENKIEFDESVPVERKNNSASSGSANKVPEESVTPILSENELENLQTAISKENNQFLSESPPKAKSDSKTYEYIDNPVVFDDPGARRELLINPPPEIPDDLPSGFPPEIIYTVKFSLNSDGMIQVLSMTPSSVYPEIDASIRKALRSWVFKRSEGSEVVYGTITLIFKGK